MGENAPKILAVIVAAIVYWLIGAPWFSLMQAPWLVGIGKTMQELQASGLPKWLPHVVTLISNFAMAYVLGWLILATGPQTLMRGITIGAILWIFIGAAFATEYVFEARSVQLFAINAGYPLVGMILMGGILGAWKK
jgi:Protein of unknown function (DUF1761)